MVLRAGSADIGRSREQRSSAAIGRSIVRRGANASARRWRVAGNFPATIDADVEA
jgi:hypothetical protein